MQASTQQQPSHLTTFLLAKSLGPILLFVTIYLAEIAIMYVPEMYLTATTKNTIAFYLKDTAPVLAIYWLCVNFLRAGIARVITWATLHNHPAIFIVISPIRNSLYSVLLLMAVNMTLSSLQLEGVVGVFFDKLAKVLLIVTIATIFCKMIYSLEQYINDKYITSSENLPASRKIQTQIAILGRLAIFVIVMVSVAAVIMVFDSLRNIGTSLLTTAGIISAIGAFASQQSLGRVFAGLQLAFTQPIRIGDTVVIDNEFGQVEEISLSFITVKLWDLRRLILPTDYFIQKGVLNLSLPTAELLGTVFLYADYTLPVEQVRQKFLELVHASPLWNEKTASLEVTDFKEHSIELRCLVSADDASNLWKLRCQLREALIQYVVNNHHNALTKTRTLSFSQPATATT